MQMVVYYHLLLDFSLVPLTEISPDYFDDDEVMEMEGKWNFRFFLNCFTVFQGSLLQIVEPLSLPLRDCLYFFIFLTLFKNSQINQ